MWNDLYKSISGMWSFDSLSPIASSYLTTATMWALVFLFAWILYWIVANPVYRILSGVARRTSTNWDNYFFSRRLMRSVAFLVFAITVASMIPRASLGVPTIVQSVAMLCRLLRLVAWFMLFFQLIYTVFEGMRREGIQIHGMVVMRNIVTTVIAVVFGLMALSVILNRNIAYLLSGLGAMAAVLSLVFKDSILGVVAGIKLTVNRMLHINDWIRVPKFEADGRVEDITLTAIKIRNWDNSIVTVPPYELISGGFNNMEYMVRSGGRRIKRRIIVDVNSVRYLQPSEMEAWRDCEWAEGVDFTRPAVNLTLLRKFLGWRVMQFGETRGDMLNMIRELEPDEHGIPIEIYLFTTLTEWKAFEEKQCEIMDEVYASVAGFGLRLYSLPSAVSVSGALKAAPVGQISE